MIIAMVDITLAASRPLKQSRTMAAELTTQAPPPRAWTKRQASSSGSEPTVVIARLASRKTTRPPSSTGLRPSRSESGPNSSWPRAKPARKVESDSSVWWMLAPTSSASTDMAGR
jgi:hypothetical protein